MQLYTGLKIEENCQYFIQNCRILRYNLLNLRLVYYNPHFQDVFCFRIILFTLLSFIFLWFWLKNLYLSRTFDSAAYTGNVSLKYYTENVMRLTGSYQILEISAPFKRKKELTVAWFTLLLSFL